MKRYGSKRSPNVVYTKLAENGKERTDKLCPFRPGRVYSITEKGRKMANYTPNIIEEIYKTTPIILA